MSLRLPKTQAKSSSQPIDFAGQATWTLGITALIAAIIEWPKLGFNSPFVMVGLAVSMAMFMIFLYVEKKVKHPMLPFHLFNSHRFNLLLLLGAVLNGSYYGSVFVLSLYLQQVLHYGSLAAGLAFIPLTAGFVISNVASARIINQYGTWRPILAGLGMFAVGFAGLFIAGANTPYWQLFLPFLIISTGMGLAVPAMINGVLSSVDKQLSGTASAILTTARQTAGAMGVAIFGAMAAGGAGAIMGGVYKAAAISIVFTFLAILLIAGLLRKQQS